MPKKPVTIWLDEDEIQLVNEIAKELGIPRSALLRMIILNALRRAKKAVVNNDRPH